MSGPHVKTTPDLKVGVGVADDSAREDPLIVALFVPRTDGEYDFFDGAHLTLAEAELLHAKLRESIDLVKQLRFAKANLRGGDA